MRALMHCNRIFALGLGSHCPNNGLHASSYAACKACHEVLSIPAGKSGAKASKQSMIVQHRVIMQGPLASKQRCCLSQAAPSAAPPVCAPAAGSQRSTPPATPAAGRFPPPVAAAPPEPVPYVPAASKATAVASCSTAWWPHSEPRKLATLDVYADLRHTSLYTQAWALGGKRRQRARQTRSRLSVPLSIHRAANQS